MPRIQFEQLSLSQLRWFVALCSALLSVEAFLTDDIINKDGILYVQMAEALLQGGFQAMADLYDWPFYAILTAVLSAISGLSAQFSASIINIVLFVLFTDSLLRISAKLIIPSRQLAIAAILILLFLSLNNYRDFIVRDVGYWAFVSLALLHFLNFLRTGALHHGLYWQAYTFIAFLFRIEALFLLLAMPLLACFQSRQVSWPKQIFSLYGLTLITLFGAMILLVLSDGWSEVFGRLSLIADYTDSSRFMFLFEQNRQFIADKILHPVSEDAASLFLASALFGIIVGEILLGLSVSYLILWVMASRYPSPPLPQTERIALVYFLFLNGLILYVLLLNTYLMTTRYGVMAFTSLFLMILPKISGFIDECYQNKRRVPLFIIGMLLLYSLGDAVYQSHSKSYLPATAKWAATTLPDNSRVATLDVFSAYYLEQYAGDRLRITQHSLQTLNKQTDYLLIVSKNRHGPGPAMIPTDLSLTVLHHQESDRGDSATLYQVQNQ
ncbi:hypothetical protein [Methylophaga frappieri]|nr:hypothetical protein [Methylophaga frappieri]